jgi:RHS repeat-associated protein
MTPALPASLVRYTYDGSGSLVKSEVDGVITYYVGRHYHLIVEGTDETVKKYYSIGMTQIAVRTIEGESDTLNWILTDHLSSASVIANEDGTLISEVKYSAFGEIRFNTGDMPTDYQYTGQLSQMDEIGLLFFVARWADPLTGHFVQADTIVPSAGNPGTYNRYAYARYNPIKFNDPSGHDVRCSAADPKCKSTNYYKPTIKQTINTVLKKMSSVQTFNAWYTGKDVNYQGSSGKIPYLGHGVRQAIGNMHGLGQNNAADGIPTMVMRGLAQYPSVEIVGNSLNNLKNNPEIKIYREKVLIPAALDGEKTHSRPVTFGSQGSVSLWLNESSYTIRLANVDAELDFVDSNTLRIDYSITDIYDLTPDWKNPKRTESGYNFITTISGFLYHYLLGGNEHMIVNARWTEFVPVP